MNTKNPMKKISIVLCALSMMFASCNESKKEDGDRNSIDPPQQNTNENFSKTQDQNASVKVVKYEELLKDIRTESKEYKVVNFWATWCVPCVKELPYFFNEIHNGGWADVEWIFVSLDEARLLESKVKKFIQDNKYSLATHYLLDDNGRQQQWIDSFTTEWSGSIPATAIYKSGTLIDFHEGIFTEQELKSFLSKNITNK